MIFPPELVLVSSPVCPESACGAVSGGNLGSCGQMSGLWSLESGHWTSLGTSKYITITSHRSPACYRERSGAVTASNRSFIIRNPTIGHLSDWLSYNSYQCHQHRCCQHWTTPPSPLAENVLVLVTQAWRHGKQCMIMMPDVLNEEYNTLRGCLFILPCSSMA